MDFFVYFTGGSLHSESCKIMSKHTQIRAFLNNDNGTTLFVKKITFFKTFFSIKNPPVIATDRGYPKEGNYAYSGDALPL